MREIKFRYVWKRKEDGHIYMEISSVELLGQKESGRFKGNELWKLIGRDQHTGLRDKNGNDIYEGDIIQGYVSDEDDDGEVIERRLVRRVVKWLDGAPKGDPGKKDNPSTFNQNPQFVGDPIDGYEDGSMYWSEFHECEIIGNIHEDKDLLVKAG